MEMKTPSGFPPQHKSSSLATLVAHANSRVTLTLDKAIEHELKHGRKLLDPDMDRKKLRRTISNRLSAQRSRMKKAQHINDMEKIVTDLEELISVLSPQVESYKEKRNLMMLQNDSLQKLIEIRSTEANFSEIELEAKRAEINRLRELEKIVNRNSNDSNLFGPQEMQDFRLKQMIAQPYPSLGFYQNGLQHVHKFEFNNCQRQRMASNSCNDQQLGFMFKLPINMPTTTKAQEEAEIDQYLNFEALNVDEVSSSSD